MNISDKIKKILKTKKWTQTRLASELKISPARLNTYYLDKNDPSADWVIDSIDKLHKECEAKTGARYGV